MSAFAMLGELAWQVKHGRSNIIIHLFSVLRGVRGNLLSLVLLDCLSCLVLCSTQKVVSSDQFHALRKLWRYMFTCVCHLSSCGTLQNILIQVLAAPSVIKKLHEMIHLEEGDSESSGLQICRLEFGSLSCCIYASMGF